MKNLMHEHPDENVRSAMLHLADALCSWERSTGRHNIVIIKDSIGCEYRALDGHQSIVSDAMLLETFDAINQHGN
jgi:hypothetical protein